MSDTVEDVIEEATDAVEETFETIKRHISVNLSVAIGIGILAAGAGFAAGYFFGRRPRKLTAKEMAEIKEINEGLQEMKAQREAEDKPPRFVVDADYLAKRDAELVDSGLKVGDVVIDPEDGQEGVVIAIHYPDEDEEPVMVNQEPIRRNVFAEQADPEDDWDYHVEQRLRSPGKPYVIHRDEFFSDEDELDHHQHQLTFYNGDGVLVDEERNVVQSHQMVVGEMKFGHGSGDPNVVYVRNERLKADYEIWLDSGRFDVEVGGADMEDVLEHQERRSAVRKFRQE